MSTLPLVLQDDARPWQPLRTGAALAATVSVFYTLCTFVWVVAPGPFVRFMSSLFHGMDFAPLLKAAAFSWAGFAEALLVTAVWFFFAGTFFSWLHRRWTT